MTEREMTMVERVARAIFDVCSVDGVTLSWEKVDQGKRDLHMEWAAAAIEEMRNPTEAMTAAGSFVLEGMTEEDAKCLGEEEHFQSGVWKSEQVIAAMINSALKEQGEKE